MPVQNRDEDPTGGPPEQQAGGGETRPHPLGAGVGAAGGALSGAAIGSAAGVVGAAIGAAVGGVTGALAGRKLAQALHPEEEDAYWRANYASRPYVARDSGYATYQPAYRHGWEATARHPGREFEEIEPDLRREWESAAAQPALPWRHAREAVRDAWHRARQGASPAASSERDEPGSAQPGSAEEDR